MKRFYFIVLCLLNYTFSFSQWTKIFTLPANEYFKSIGASAGENPWVVAGITSSKNIYIYNSLDGGATWKKRNGNGLPANVFQWNILQVYAVNTKTAFLCAEIYFNSNADTGYIFKTTDGGNNWKTVFASPGFCDIKMGLFNTYAGLMSCTISNSQEINQQNLYYTKNSGNTWQLDKLNPVAGNTISDLVINGAQTAIVDYNYFYYSPFYSLFWQKQKVPHPNSSQYNNLQFENGEYEIVNEGALINLFVKRPDENKWKQVGDPTTNGGAVTGLILNKNECWLAVGLDDLKNYYSSDSAKTFSSFIADTQSGFIQMIKAKNDNAIFGSTFGNGGRLWVHNIKKQSAPPDNNMQKIADNLQSPSVYLQQNVPNPYNHTTSIAYNLPTTFSSAQIIVTDITGKTLKTINVSGNGKGVLHLDASTLSSGSYNYSLYVNGKLIGSKKMILSK